MKRATVLLLCIFIFADARYISRTKDHARLDRDNYLGQDKESSRAARERRQAFKSTLNPNLSPLTNPVGYNPALLNPSYLTPVQAQNPFQQVGQFQGRSGANLQTNSGTVVEAGLDIDGLNLWDGDIFRGTNTGNFGTGGAVSETGIDILGTSLANIGSGTALGGGRLPGDPQGPNIPGLTTKESTPIDGSPQTQPSSIFPATDFFAPNAGTAPAGAAPTGLAALGALGQGFGPASGTAPAGLPRGLGGLSAGTSSRANIGPVDVASARGISSQGGDLAIGRGGAAKIGGADLYDNSDTTVLKNRIPGLSGPQGIPNPYDPYGSFRGGYGIGRSRGGTALGTGYRIPEYYGFDWPNDGVRVEKNVVIPFLGHPIAEYNIANLNVKPKDSLAQYDFSDHKGFTTIGTGFKKGWKGDGGINGYNFNDRFSVPVLGTKVVDVQDKSGFDLSKFRFTSAKEGQYGPVRVVSNANTVELPWVGQLIQRGLWNSALTDAGYAPDDKSALPPGLIPGVPIIG